MHHRRNAPTSRNTHTHGRNRSRPTSEGCRSLPRAVTPCGCQRHPSASTPLRRAMNKFTENRGEGEKLDLSLVEIVKKHPCIYEKTLEAYRDRDAAHEAWSDIAEKTGLSAFECKERWTCLRNSFSHAMQRRISKPSLASRGRKWRLEKEMAFLLPHMSVGSRRREASLRRKRPKVERQSSEERGDAVSTSSEIEDAHEDESEVVFEVMAETDEFKSLAEKTPDSVTIEKNRQSRGTSVSAQALDDTDLFFLSAAGAAKRLPAADLVRLRLRVAELVAAAELSALDARRDSDGT